MEDLVSVVLCLAKCNSQEWVNEASPETVELHVHVEVDLILSTLIVIHTYDD